MKLLKRFFSTGSTLPIDASDYVSIETHFLIVKLDSLSGYMLNVRKYLQDNSAL
jgi:hypothetical protein